MAHDEDLEKVRDALVEFIHTIGNTGGVTLHLGYYEPKGDPEWIDLGAAYVKACEVMEIEPLIHEYAEEEATP